MFRSIRKILYSSLLGWKRTLGPHIEGKMDGQSGGGFTMVELMVASTVLGALAAISIPLYTQQVYKAKITKAIAEIKAIEFIISAYELDNHSLPTSLDDINWGKVPDPWGNPYKFLNFEHELSKKGGGESGGKSDKKGGGSSHGGGIAGIARKWHGDVPINEFYDLYSMGKDGKTVKPIVSSSGRDDIIRANDGLFVGLASNY